MSAAPGASTCTADACRRAATRWKLGHQVFHLELAAMTTLIDRTSGELVRRDATAVGRSLALLAELYDGSTAAMAYASDFPPRCYERVVRPAMSPPLVSPGFSGLLNREHAVMLDKLLALMKSLATACGDGPGARPSAGTALRASPGLASAVAGLRAAISRNRQAHGKVCQLHVPGGVSLLQSFYQAGGGREPIAAARRRSAAAARDRREHVEIEGGLR